MSFQIVITDEAERQLRRFSVHDQRIIESAVSSRLEQAPITITRAIKPLRANSFAQWEMRVGDFRVLYNVEQQDVVILLVGRKVGNRLVVEGVEFHEHQDDPTHPTDGPSGADPDGVR